jgi:hypothetical protein
MDVSGLKGEIQAGSALDHSDEVWPVQQVANILEAYCRSYMEMKLPKGAKRRATGPRSSNYVMLREFYEVVYWTQSAQSERICYKLLKAAKMELQFRKIDIGLLDDQKLSAWGSACESLLTMGVSPGEFLGALSKAGGLEKLRHIRKSLVSTKT